jgi:hypothetical protein
LTLETRDIKVQAWDDIFVIFRNNLNGFWHFYHGTPLPHNNTNTDNNNNNNNNI